MTCKFKNHKSLDTLIGPKTNKNFTDWEFVYRGRWDARVIIIYLADNLQFIEECSTRIQSKMKLPP